MFGLDIPKRLDSLENQVTILLDCLRWSGCCRRGGRVVFSIGLVTDTPVTPPKAHQFRRNFCYEEYDVATTMKTEQEYVLTVQFLNDKGKPAKVDGVPAWATDNSDLLTLTPAADGMSCKVASGLFDGAGSVKVSADADLGAGVTLIEGVDAVTVVARPATTVTLAGSSPVDTP